MRILIVEVNWLGDVLFSTPAIKALRKRFPDSFIACLIVPRVKEILENNPYINELIINDETGAHRGFFGKIGLAQELRKKEFDIALLFHRSSTRAFITYLAGIRRRIGYYTLKRACLLTERLPMPEKDSLHRVDYYLGIVKALGCNTEDRFYDFFTAQEDDNFAEGFLQREGVGGDDFVVCLNPGGNWSCKRWPKENFAKLADALISDYRMKVILSGSKEDINLVDGIVKTMTHKPIVATGKTNLKQLASLYKKVHLAISGDSGPLHIASSVGVNVIALFGPTSPAITAPIGKGKIRLIQKEINCKIPCYEQNCYDNRCMRQISVEDVLLEARSLQSIIRK